MAKQIPEPVFCVWIPDEENTIEQLYDRISGKSLTRSHPNITSIAYDSIDNFRCLQFTANNYGCEYQILLSEIEKVYNSFKNGEYTVITFMSFPPDSYPNDSSHRWGWMCTWNSAQIFSWTTNSPNTSTQNPASNGDYTTTFIIPFDGSGDRTHLGMIAKSVSFSQDRALCTYRDDGSSIQNDITKFILREYNNLGLGGNSFSGIATSNYLIIGRSQESSYYAGRNIYSRYVGFAIYDKALDAEQLKYIYDNKKLFSFQNPNIIEVPDISILKTVNGRKQLLSLRDQKIKKDGVLHSFGVGSGIKYGENLYVLGREEEPILEPIVTMTTTNPYSNNLSFTITKQSDIEVDWGDGTRDKNTFSHTYSDGLSSHDVTFYGRKDSLTHLMCNHNSLTSLDVSECIALTYLGCYVNSLTSLDVSKNTALTELECEVNNLSSLDVSKNTALTYLNCNQNKLLSSLDVSKNTALTKLLCWSNGLSSLDVSNNKALTHLECYASNLSSLDVSKNTALGILLCGHNNISSLDVSKNTALTHIECPACPLIGNQSTLTSLANSLPDRTGKEAGTLIIYNSISAAWIQDICTAKNWTIK